MPPFSSPSPSFRTTRPRRVDGCPPTVIGSSQRRGRGLQPFLLMRTLPHWKLCILALRAGVVFSGEGRQPPRPKAAWKAHRAPEKRTTMTPFAPLRRLPHVPKPMRPNNMLLAAGVAAFMAVMAMVASGGTRPRQSDTGAQWARHGSFKFYSVSCQRGALRSFSGSGPPLMAAG